jgi:hypothetical protein
LIVVAPLGHLFLAEDRLCQGFELGIGSRTGILQLTEELPDSPGVHLGEIEMRLLVPQADTTRQPARDDAIGHPRLLWVRMRPGRTVRRAADHPARG